MLYAHTQNLVFVPEKYSTGIDELMALICDTSGSRSLEKQIQQLK